MDRADLTFRNDGGDFSLRVRAIILDGGRLLMVRQPLGYYYPVGGRVHLGESSVDALLREVLEETGVAMEIDRLGFLHENFFFDEKRGANHHEIALYYYMRPLPGLSARRLCGSSGDALCWLPLDALAPERLYPTFFKTRLTEPSDRLEHIFTWEN